MVYELATGEVHVFHSRIVLLATGGFGKVYKTTSNCFANTGDGVFLALSSRESRWKIWNSSSFIPPGFTAWGS